MNFPGGYCKCAYGNIEDNIIFPTLKFFVTINLFTNKQESPLLEAAKKGDLLAVQIILNSIDVEDPKNKNLLWNAYVIIVEHHRAHPEFKKVAQPLFKLLDLGNRETQIKAQYEWMILLANGEYHKGDLLRLLYDFNYRLHDDIKADREEYEVIEHDGFERSLTPSFHRSRSVLQHTMRCAYAFLTRDPLPLRARL